MEKCFTEEHKEIDAISFCPECKIYMCDKCAKVHSSFLKMHNPYNIDKDVDIFTGYCKEKNHPNKLKYFCKIHNQLCCSACIAKLNKEGDGQHKDCDVCYIEEIKDEKKNKLKENIKVLENLENTFADNIKKLKEIFDNMERNKVELKLKVQDIFAKMKNILNEREEILLLEIDKIYNTNYFNEDLIKKGEELPKQIKLSLEKGKLIDKEWNNDKLYSYINDCINIENNIKNLNIFEKNINNYKSNNQLKIEFYPKEEQINIFLSSLNSFGKINYNKPQNLKKDNADFLSDDDGNLFTKEDNGLIGTISKNKIDKSLEEHKKIIEIFKKEKKNFENVFKAFKKIYNTYQNEFSEIRNLNALLKGLKGIMDKYGTNYIYIEIFLTNFEMKRRKKELLNYILNKKNSILYGDLFPILDKIFADEIIYKLNKLNKLNFKDTNSAHYFDFISETYQVVNDKCVSNEDNLGEMLFFYFETKIMNDLNKKQEENQKYIENISEHFRNYLEHLERKYEIMKKNKNFISFIFIIAFVKCYIYKIKLTKKYNNKLL